MSVNPIGILIVDDDEPFRERLKRSFIDRGHVTEVAGTLSHARDLLESLTPTHCILDLRLATESGLDLIEDLNSSGTRVIILTGYGSVATALEAVRRGAANYLSKPASFVDIESCLFGPALKPVGEQKSESAIPTLEKVEWEHIQRVLRDCNGNITHTAKLLGIHRQALQRKLRAQLST